MRLFIVILLLCTSALQAAPQTISPGKMRTLYNSLDKFSVAQHLAFYSLYPQSQEGQMALQHAWRLLSSRNETASTTALQAINASAVNAVIALVNKHSTDTVVLNNEEIQWIEKLAKRLPNRSLRGFHATSENDVLALPPDEIDLARGLFIAQLSDGTDAKISSYEALIDLMALQILARLPPNASPEAKIRAINDFVFNEMGFRFPPHSTYSKDLDMYTFLPSVLDSRRGVCLGVSILYICIAQRMNLSLEMITPPGHIYVRYRPATGSEINIETTARGIHLDSEEYLGVNTRFLQKRNIKEVIGLAFFNQASICWETGEHEKALQAYHKAILYMPDDKHLKELMAYQYVLSGREEEGRHRLEEVRNYVPDFAVSGETIAEDFLNGNVDVEGLRATLQSVEKERELILKRKNALEEVVARCPKFRAGVFHLAVAWLQLHREGEALDVLRRYHALEPNDPTAEHYLTVLSAMRLEYDAAWDHFHRLEQILNARNHHPKMLREIRRELTLLSPE